MKYITEYQKFHFSRLIAEMNNQLSTSKLDQNETKIKANYVYVVLDNAMKWEKTASHLW